MEEAVLFSGFVFTAAVLFLSIRKIYTAAKPHVYGKQKQSPRVFVEENKAIRYYDGSVKK